MIMRRRRDGCAEWLPEAAGRMAFWNPEAGLLRLSDPRRGLMTTYEAPPGFQGTPHRIVRVWMTRGDMPMRPWIRL